MQIIESGAKYPLVNGRHEFSDGSYVEISNGNHIMFYKSINGGGYINISDISQNSDTIDNVKNINYKPKIYTIPAGVQTRFEVKNVKGIGDYDAQTNFRISEKTCLVRLKQELLILQIQNLIQQLKKHYQTQKMSGVYLFILLCQKGHL